jgi:hypothetical protein
MNERTRLNKYKILYHYPDDLIVDTKDEFERFTKYIGLLGEEWEKDDNVLAIYMIVITKKRMASIYVEFKERRSVLNVKNVMKECKLDMSLVEFYKIEGRIKDYLKNFFTTAYYLNENLYIFQRDEGDLDKGVEALTQHF